MEAGRRYKEVRSSSGLEVALAGGDVSHLTLERETFAFELFV